MISTAGDRTQDSGEPLPSIGGKGLFTAELERALRDGAIDVAVHSLKDLPTEDAPGVAIGAVTAREDVRDCLVACTAGSARGAARRGGRRHEQPAAIGAARGVATGPRDPLDPRERRHADPQGRRRRVRRRSCSRRPASGGSDSTTSSPSGSRTRPCSPAPGQGALAIQCRADDERPARAARGARRPGGTGRDDRGAGLPAHARRRLCGAGRGSGGHDDDPSGASPGPRRLGRWTTGGSVTGEGEPADVGERLAEEALSLGADRILASVR